MSRQEREAFAAMVNADPALKQAMAGFSRQLDRSMAALAKLDPADDDQVDEAVAAITDTRQAVRVVYVAAGLDPDRADPAPDDE